MMNLPELGVGLIYSSALEPLLAEAPDLIDVLEIEPQTLWAEQREGETPYVVRAEVDEHLASLPGRKLVHSVGTPVGGSIQSYEAQMPLLRNTVEKLDAPWASEHLSFNLTEDFFTGFFLPPRQTAAGVAVYVEAIDKLRTGMGVPLAIETGVNYFRPRPDDIPDGAFMAAVAEDADCGILLDLHNLYTNQLNGRQSIEAFLDELPLERVWEVHLAGGFEMEGFWLDSHSGAVPELLLAICQEVIPQLPNLKAIIFEIFASFLPRVGLETVRGELEKLRGLWEIRGSADARTKRSENGHHPYSATIPVSPREWEEAVGKLVIGRPPETPLEADLAADPGVPLVQDLIKEFRGSMVVQVYRLTCRLLMLALTPDVFRAILEDFWSQTPPQQFAASEAEAFGDYLVAKNVRLPQLQNILTLERATVRTLTDGQPRLVRFNVDPLPMLRALSEGKLLVNPGQEGDYEIEITPDGPLAISPAYEAARMGSS